MAAAAPASDSTAETAIAGAKPSLNDRVLGGRNRRRDAGPGEHERVDTTVTSSATIRDEIDVSTSTYLCLVVI